MCNADIIGPLDCGSIKTKKNEMKKYQLKEDVGRYKKGSKVRMSANVKTNSGAELFFHEVSINSYIYFHPFQVEEVTEHYRIGQMFNFSGEFFVIVETEMNVARLISNTSSSFFGKKMKLTQGRVLKSEIDQLLTPIDND